MRVCKTYTLLWWCGNCWIIVQIKGSSGLLSKITFTGEDADFLTRRMQALEVHVTLCTCCPWAIVIKLPVLRGGKQNVKPLLTVPEIIPQ